MAFSLSVHSIFCFKLLIKLLIYKTVMYLGFMKSGEICGGLRCVPLTSPQISLIPLESSIVDYQLLFNR